MLAVELVERIVNLATLELWPGLVGIFDRRLHSRPKPKRARGKNQATAAARPAYDASTRCIERRRPSERGHLSASDTTVERRREPQHRQHTYLKSEQRFLWRRSLVEGVQEPNGCVEHCWLGLVLGDTLANDGKGRACRSDCFEAPQDPVKGLIHRHALEMRKLATSLAEVRIHQHVRLKRAAEPALALARTASERRDLAVVFRQESDDSVRVAIVDGAQEERSTLAASTWHGTAEDSSIGSSCAGARLTSANVATMMAKSAAVAIASRMAPYLRRLRTDAKGAGGSVLGLCSSKRASTSPASMCTAEA